METSADRPRGAPHGPSADMDLIGLKVWVHPSMQMPFKLDPEVHLFKMEPSMLIVDLMDKLELLFEKLSKKSSQETGGPCHEMQINVLWNVKDHKKALNPNSKIGDHFESGDTFGVYGDILEALDKEFKTEDQKVPVTI
ncbi:unnamed protein product [Prorocentrum cordatum]|uniref:Uncharacterized protein n=1 Tax=Prorocentrum cordatum TaxID=2364126 RepID=A0ABN9SSC9_9DINO|nr:unnamed protein product [Polarella glacialis]